MAARVRRACRLLAGPQHRHHRLAVHILFETIWVGGLVALVLHVRWRPDGLEVAAKQNTAIAVFCFAAVAISGQINAWLRVEFLANLAGQG
ncbi:hypothetical protein DMB66_25630 [Actinoplanes sp. ATCC 53533]|nr:hypothetical protein DMB66_25630 [Actinoplanes sp. ATCC 53533]